MLVYLCLALLVAGGVTAGAQKLLFRWYMREIRDSEIAQDSSDAVTTYPFA